MVKDITPEEALKEYKAHLKRYKKILNTPYLLRDKKFTKAWRFCRTNTIFWGTSSGLTEQEVVKALWDIEHLHTKVYNDLQNLG